MNNQMCECVFWCRANIGGPYTHLKGKDLHFVVTNHHEYCPHFNDSLVDVWKISYDGQSYYSLTAPCKEETENGETVTQEKMHKEVFEQLPEFNGF